MKSSTRQAQARKWRTLGNGFAKAAALYERDDRDADIPDAYRLGVCYAVAQRSAHDLRTSLEDDLGTKHVWAYSNVLDEAAWAYKASHTRNILDATWARAMYCWLKAEQLSQ